MKNTIPLIIAVVLAGAAVFAVSRLIKPKNEGPDRNYVQVVAAARPINAEGRIEHSWLKKRSVEAASIPAGAIRWEEANRVIGLKSNRSISEGDYILLSDVVLGGKLDDVIAEGEWAVPVTFADSALVQFLQPGMEISILGTFVTEEKIEKVDATEKADVVRHEATSVVFPRVRILDIGQGDGIRREEGGRGNGTVIVALAPQQATTLVAAQRTMELYPALRRANDPSNAKRRDVGIVNETTFQKLKEHLETVVIPDGARP